MENLASGDYAISIVGGCTASFAAFSYFSTLKQNVADLKSQLAELHGDSKHFNDRLDAKLLTMKNQMLDLTRWSSAQCHYDDRIEFA